MTKVYFENTKTGKTFDVVDIDKEAGKITLRGPHSQFVEPFDKERFKKLGYVLKRKDEE